MAKAANGTGSIRENKARKRFEGRVTVGVRLDGTPVRKMVTGKTKAEVRKRMAEVARLADEGITTSARADLTVAAFLASWLDELPGTVAPATEAQYRDVARLYVAPHVGRKRLRSLQPKDVSKMLRDLEAEGRSPNTCRLARSVLRRALRWGENEGMVSRNVAALADGVKVGHVDGSAKAATLDEARTLLAHLRTVTDENPANPLEAAFVIGLSLGLRRGELLAIAWDDLDLDGTPPRLTVHRNLTRVRGKGLVLSDTKTARSRRTVQLPGPCVEALRRHRVAQLEQRLLLGDAWPEAPLGADLVFRTPLGTAVDPDNFRHRCYRVTEAAGIGKRSPHQLRHSAASLLIAQGVPMKLVSEVLGHSSIRVTADVYGHLFDEAGAITADAMTAALWGEA